MVIWWWMFGDGGGGLDLLLNVDDNANLQAPTLEVKKEIKLKNKIRTHEHIRTPNQKGCSLVFLDVCSLYLVIHVMSFHFYMLVFGLDL